MPLFTYIAEDASGKRQSGTVEAPTYDQAREVLRKRDLAVSALAEFTLSEQDPLPVESMPWSGRKKTAPATDAPSSYVPLIETLRLFAGWLIAWYGLVYFLAGLQAKKDISADIPFIAALSGSGLVLRFCFATFLFLLLTSIHERMGKGIAKGIVLTVIGILLFAGFHLYA